MVILRVCIAIFGPFCFETTPGKRIQTASGGGLRHRKGIVDRGVGAPILVTGSSSFHLGAKVRESLAGRATRERLLPLSLAEVSHDLKSLPGLARSRALEERLERHLIYGGYPEVWLGDSPKALLEDLVEAIILRDASDLFRIGRPDAFRRLLRTTLAERVSKKREMITGDGKRFVFYGIE